MTTSVEQNRCQFYLTHKKRNCRMVARKDARMCGEHTMQLSEHEISKLKHRRIPCPLDPKHSIFENDLENHLKKCNSKVFRADPWFLENINVEAASMTSQSESFILFPTLPDDEVLNFIKVIEGLYSTLNICECTYEVLEHESLKMELGKDDLGDVTRKHLVQQSSILGHMKFNGALNDNTTYIEFGAGKAKLAYNLSLCMQEFENSRFILIEKLGKRNKSENKLLVEAAKVAERFSRIRCGIEHVRLSNIEFNDETKEVVGLCKHLCGVATDFALRSAVNFGRDKRTGGSGNPNPVFSALYFAPCCHQRCVWSQFVGRKLLEDAGFDEQKFRHLCSMSSWAVCGFRPHSDTVAEKGDNNVAIDDKIGNRASLLSMTAEQKIEVGRKCKRILEHARAKFLEESGFFKSVRLCYFVETSCTPENVLMIAKCF